MDFYEVLDDIVNLLQRRGRVTYRALKLQFKLDDEQLEALKDELRYSQPQVVEDEDRGLVWSAPLPPPAPEQERAPLSYIPKHLAEKILTAQSTLEGERKQVTVLFADIKDSTELITDLDPEAAQQLLDPAIHHMMDAVHRYEGTVNQVLGDGIMALFGAPLAHEDHAIRACYAALAMQVAMHDYTEEVRRTRGMAMCIRVGLNSGEVVVRAIGNDLHMDYSAVGQTTHLAARMEQLATPGSVCLTANTLRLVEGLVEVKPLGVQAVKGLSEPLEVWALTGVTPARTRWQAPQEGSWVVRDFRFHTGEVLPELRLHYTTVGAPTGEPVLILHGTTGSGTGLLNPGFAGELFGPGQPLDGTRYYLILPDAIGTGKSTKPSDGLRASFPKYNYDDMVDAQYRLVTEHLGVRHLRLVLGHSMGGMQTWIWAQKYPDFMDIAVPMASLPTEMSGRNWMTRRLIIDAIRNDPEWMHGNYTRQPRSLQFASVFYGIATNGGNQALYKAAPTREKADALLNQRLSAPFRGDANDHLYQWDASSDYNASSGLERIQAVLLAINSADDERNPPELGLLDREITRVKNGRVLLIPGSDQTAGHGTTARARFWKQDLAELLQSAPRRAK